MKYIAFLRGINSGKNPSTKMSDLRGYFEDVGYTDVKTVLASGNVVFDSNEENVAKLEKTLESSLENRLGFLSKVTLVSMDKLQDLEKHSLFENVVLTKDSRHYVTFVHNVTNGLKFPIEGKGYSVLGMYNKTLFSIVDLAQSKTPDLMSVLDRTFGKDVTTRSWNTIEKILKLA